MTIHPTSSHLLAWYAQNARRLPWRDSKDPYTIWVSEIMLQQTRVETVIPYFQRWMEQFPDLVTLAKSELQAVLVAWEGLGYYSRARNLNNAARLVIEKYAGKIPSEYDQLIQLPGIGHSSAADILSVAYGKNLAAMDGNIKRVISRLFNLSLSLETPEFTKTCRLLLDQLLPAGEAGDFNQAMMDLGASICLPKNPACQECPLKDNCQAYLEGVQNLRPVRKAKKEIPHYIVTAGVIMDNVDQPGKVLLAKRPANGLLGGMWEYPGGKVQAGESLEECLSRELIEELGIEVSIGNNIGTYKHAYTHFRVTLHAYSCIIISGEPKPISADEIKWVNTAELHLYPMGKLDRLVTNTILASMMK
jgi:A/G-specific adenine glycosylase